LRCIRTKFIFYWGKKAVGTDIKQARPGAISAGGSPAGTRTLSPWPSRSSRRNPFSVLFKSYFQAKEMVYKNTVGSVMSDIGDRQPYMMFLVKVPYDPNINTIFQRRIRVARLVKEQRAIEADRLWLMKEVPEAFQRNGKLRRHWLEKEELCWFKIDELREGVQNPFGMMLSHGHIRLRSEFFKTLKKYCVLDKIEKTIKNKKYESQPFITV
jgi:hypothetical protein